MCRKLNHTTTNTFIYLMAGNILSICPFIAAKQAAELASKCIRLNRCWMAARRFQFSSFYSLSTNVHTICWCQLQLVDDELNGRSHGTLYAVLELPGNSRFVDGTFLPCQDRLYSRTFGENITVRFKQLLQHSA